MDKKLVLLSDSFSGFLENVWEDTKNPIIEELLLADRDIKNYNCLSEDSKLIDYLEKEINSRITDYARQLTIRLGTFEISFLPKDKEPIYVSEGVWSKTNRQAGKPTRIIRKLVKKKFTNYQYEKLNNLLKARIVDDGELVIVEGEDIRKYYNCENNNPGGTLENSCMRYTECQKYLDVYVDHCKMLVLLNKNTDKISGRAIIWEIDGKTLMDRVYYTEDHMLDIFINYAKEHKWYYRENNSLLDTGDIQYWFSPEDNYQEVQDYSFSIKIGYYDYYPYIDSFRYLVGDTLYDYPEDDYQSCDRTDGRNSSAISYECSCCHDEYYGSEDEVPDEIYWSENDGCYYCDNCCTWCDSVSDYVLNSDIRTVSIAPSYSRYYPIWYIEGNSDFVKVNGYWYTTDNSDLIYNEETGEYTLNE